jgi:hypothetical protein
MDVVLADGKQVHATPTNYPDIYYALRGAADSFGIITNFYLQTQPAPPQVVSFSASFASALQSASKAADVVLRLQKFALSSSYMDRNITLEIYMNILGQYSVRGWYFGGLDYFSKNVFPAMLDGMPKSDNTTIKTMTWLVALEDIAEGEPLTEPLTGYNNHQTFYTKSVVTREAQPLTRTALESFFGYVINKGLSSKYPWNTFISLYGGKDSQINTPSSQSAAYSHRDSLWVFQVSSHATSKLIKTNTTTERRLLARFSPAFRTRNQDVCERAQHCPDSCAARRQLSGLSKLSRSRVDTNRGCPAVLWLYHLQQTRWYQEDS